ncbi:GntR family transcriptional regulator [Devosia naphthalenivorans]|uniref:GntR family transcriptional regulator n=1 Tax=Devosia naphthalenivorans TaxID=2082392 RepID=UPI0013B065B4|nr:GntR family transcriptional regulator [Devosia naphthalenivorans]
MDGTAKYARISRIFRSKIASGEWPIGHQIPTIDQLQNEYGVSRVTIRQAISLLIDADLVKSDRGRGTFVTADVNNASTYTGFIDAGSFPSDFSDKNLITVISRSSFHDIPRNLRQNRTSAGPYTFVKKLHSSDGVVLFLYEVFIATELYEEHVHGLEETLPVQKLLTKALLESRANVETTVMVVPADFSVAQLLRCEASEPVCQVCRCFYAEDGRILLKSCAYYRSDSFRFKSNQTFIQYLSSKDPTNSFIK